MTWLRVLGVSLLIVLLLALAGLFYFVTGGLVKEKKILEESNARLKEKLIACNEALIASDTTTYPVEYPPADVAVPVPKIIKVVVRDTVRIVLNDTIKSYVDSVKTDDYTIGYFAITRGDLVRLRLFPKFNEKTVTNNNTVYIPVDKKCEDVPHEIQVYGVIDKSLSSMSYKIGPDVIFGEKYIVGYSYDFWERNHYIKAGIKLYEK